MLRISREIRFPLLPPGQFTGDKPDNSWAGGPATNQLVPRLNLRCEVQGTPDAKTGYLCNIKLLDNLLRRAVAANLPAPSDGESSPATAESLLRSVGSWCLQQWQHHAGIAAIELDLTPFLSYRINAGENQMFVTEQFEFSAAHRLHCDDLSDEENRETFGKCNHPNGHGHNYVVQVTLVANDDGSNKTLFDLHHLEKTVNANVIDRLDHKNLNLDEPHFAGVNPTVENIAIAIYGWLDGKLGDARLDRIRVYETPKTWAEYAGQA